MPPVVAVVTLSLIDLALTTGGPAGTYTISAPSVITELDARSIKGTPTQLAWSDEGSEWYLQTAEGSRVHHYLIHVENPRPEEIDDEPEWGWAYWTWKSGRSAPDDPSLMIAAEVSRQSGQVPNQTSRQRANSQWDGATAIGAAIAASNEVNWSSVITLTLHDHVVGRFKERVVPGLTFGWSPPGEHGFAYVTAKGRLAVLDLHGTSQDVAGTDKVLLPGWSPDGSAIAFLRQTGRNRYTLEQVAIDVK